MSWWSSLWERLASWWRGDLTRSVARIGGDADVDQVVETVRLSGTLTEHGRRRILRDPKLLPKPQPTGWSAKRPRILTRDEASRLFGGTLRTRNREIRDLLPDPDQLQRHGLPHLASEVELAALLDVSLTELRFFSIHRVAERQPHHVVFRIPKRGGGFRTITAPKRRLRAVQRRLLARLVNLLPVSDAAHGFRKGRSVATHAAPHVGRKVVVKLDLEDFFHTVTWQRVRGYLIAMGYGFPVATTIAVLATEAERQPVDLGDRVVHVPVGPRRCVQGAPTSPALCNAIAHKLDRRLLGAARALGFTYTRYADDLTFSGDDATRVSALLGLVRKIVVGEGFRLNDTKTRVMRAGGRQRVTGVTVNQVLGISRRERRRVRAMIHQHGDDPAWRDRIAGQLGWVGAVNPEQAAALRARWRRG
ncbi:MAG: RNA-directed DNA polymerase [Myxococcales bacterium]|nr:RNA-directed DNA polymerase [Myxococcales bacterium]